MTPTPRLCSFALLALVTGALVVSPIAIGHRAAGSPDSPRIGPLDWPTGPACSSPLSLNVSASPISGTAPLVVQLSSGVQGGCPPVEVHWEFGDGGGANGTNVTHTFEGAGLYHVWVRATDSADQEADASLEVVVTGGEGTAILSVGVTPSSGPAPLAVTCWANVSGGNFSDDVRVFWAFGDGGSGTGSPVAHVFTDAGTFTISAQAQGEYGQLATGSYNVTVGPAGAQAPPVLWLNATPSGGSAPLNVSVSASARGTVDGLMLSICFGDGGSCVAGPAGWTGAPAVAREHTYGAPGNYSASATLRTANGTIVATATTSIRVGPVSPVAIRASAVALGGGQPSTVRFEASASGGTPPYSVQWEFGDGAFGASVSGSSVDHTYPHAGTFQAVVIVIDAAGHRVQQAMAPVTLLGPNILGVPSGYWLGGGLGGIVALAAVGPFLARRRRQRRLRREGEMLVRQMEQAK